MWVSKRACLCLFIFGPIYSVLCCLSMPARNYIKNVSTLYNAFDVWENFWVLFSVLCLISFVRPHVSRDYCLLMSQPVGTPHYLMTGRSEMAGVMLEYFHYKHYIGVSGCLFLKSENKDFYENIVCVVRFIYSSCFNLLKLKYHSMRFIIYNKIKTVK